MSDEFVALQVKVVELEGRVNVIALDLQHLTGSTNARLSEIEGKLGSIDLKTDGQTVTIGEIKTMVCNHKDDQAKQMVAQGLDIALIKKAVVVPQTSIWGMRVYRGIVSAGIVVVGLIMWAFPQTVPIVIRLLERLATGSSH